MRVCTGFAPQGYIQYGKNFLDTFAKFWPEEIELSVYTEEPVEMPRGDQWSVFECDGLKGFLDKNEGNDKYRGKVPMPTWKPREVEAGYSYKFDAIKFCKQLFIPEHAASMMMDDDILCWLDGDVVSFKDVPPHLVEDLLGPADLVYLGRPPKHSEIGFWAVRLNDRSRMFLEKLAHIYRSGIVFSLPVWHSAAVFDEVRVAMQPYGLKEKNLTPTGTGHVWLQTPLSLYTEHLKGNRKDAGLSRRLR